MQGAKKGPGCCQGDQPILGVVPAHEPEETIEAEAEEAGNRFEQV